ncbi:MAG: hypothetical protein HUJ56_05540 [Erysipelotrichaceae bacterium]|nr:hypothetical protein [Erysipelotrichaceae bacterium]
MLQINNIKTPITTEFNTNFIAKQLHIKESDIITFEILKKSLDARKNHFSYNYSIALSLRNEHKYHIKEAIPYTPYHYEPIIATNDKIRPIIIGFGPSGIFAGLILAQAGLKPIILEKGSSMHQRITKVNHYWKTGEIDPECNVQFGEGGAGTFSDGKLTTRIKDNRVKKVIEEFIEAGADESIRYEAHPHLGTDKLRFIVPNLRNKIISLGGEVFFDTEVKDIIIENNQITAIQLKDKVLPCTHILLCAGHSASDLFKNLTNKIHIEPKDFAIGVRVEHPQSLINENQHMHYADLLPPAEYHLTHTATNGRGVYSFCMCPGGEVVASASSPHTIVTNGMSYSHRNAPLANSAILVQVKKEDFDHGNPLDGFLYQEKLEKKTYALTNNHKAPVSNIKDFLNHTTTPLVNMPSYSLGYQQTDLHGLFDEPIEEALKEGFINFDTKIKGFIEHGTMTASETRSSSPVRITRTPECESISLENLFPCGEGAGYAGGIVSSAVDGIRCAEKCILKINKSLK